MGQQGIFRIRPFNAADSVELEKGAARLPLRLRTISESASQLGEGIRPSEGRRKARTQPARTALGSTVPLRTLTTLQHYDRTPDRLRHPRSHLVSRGVQCPSLPLARIP